MKKIKIVYQNPYMKGLTIKILKVINRFLSSNFQIDYFSGGKVNGENKISEDSRKCQIQSVKGISREKSRLDNLNPFLIDEDDESDLEATKVTTAKDDYWTHLKKQKGSKSDIQDQSSKASDACTQTDKNIKKNGCKVM